MLRKFALLAGVAAVVAVLVPSGASAATGACALGGTAHVKPGLTTKSHSFTFTFGGSLNACQGTGKIKKGTLSASGSGAGTCASTNGKGSATVNWNTGQSSGISFTFKGVGNLVLVQGKVTSGPFSGQAVNAPIAFTKTVPGPAACLNTGLTTFSFSGAAII